MKTTLLKEHAVKRTWYLIDASNKPAGRLAAKISHILRGKHKPSYTPHADMGDIVVVINAEKVKLTGDKEEQKMYESISGYPSGLKLTKASDVRIHHPELIISHAVKGMLPKNKLSRRLLGRLKIYAGAKNPHAAQQLKIMDLKV